MRTNITMKDGRNFWIEAFTGKVSDAAKSKEMKITSPVEGVVESQTETRHEFWLTSDTGEERFFRLPNDILPIRTGHVLTIFYGAVGNTVDGQPLCVLQRTTNRNLNFLEGDVGDKTYLQSCGFVHSQALFLFSAIGVLSVVGIPLVLLVRYLASTKRKQVFYDWRQKVIGVINSPKVASMDH